MVSYSALTDRSAVDEAIAEFDKLGREEFLAKYGFRKARDYYLVTDAGRYDSKAIFGVAYGIQHGENLNWRDFTGGKSGAAGQLRALGYHVEGEPGNSPLIEDMSFWWVNQGWTEDHEEDITFLWAGLADAGGSAKSHWESLDSAELGDTVLHYANGFVVGASRVQVVSTAMVRPSAFEINGRTGDDGRQVVLGQLSLFDIPVPLTAIPMDLRVSALESGSPFTINGDVKRGYFFALSQPLAVAVFTAAFLVEQSDTESSGAPDDGVGPRELVLKMTETDGYALVRVRKEQGALRRALFGGAATARCELCGRRYPVRFLHTAHIKARRECTSEERLDWKNVVMAACVFGCDAMFEDGMLRVDGTGRMSVAERGSETAALAAFSASLAERVAPAFTPSRKRYFDWRNAQG